MVGANTMIPSGLQVPPRPWEASAIAVAGPPEMSILISFPEAKKPIDLLSGDENGKIASSVPAKGCAVTESIGRSHSWLFLSSEIAANTTCLPSATAGGDR